ncbi:surfeit locus protein 1-like isoform X2 [Dysidea avara]|uniref:surfeit locus protein 1-like isoform X2 n=1 Tax=Dysidea avara TaxID=196820 RepID=UPI00331E8485
MNSGMNRFSKVPMWLNAAGRVSARRYAVKTRSRQGASNWLIIIPLTTFGLGTWQIYRLRWKLDLIKKLEERTKEDTIVIPTDIVERVEELEYRHVKVHGEFDHSKEIFMWPRSRLVEGTRGSGAHGAHVITPFHCDDTGNTILINRGWVPTAKMDASTRKEGQTEGKVTLTAVVRAPEKKQRFAPKGEEGSNKWQYRNVKEMADYTRTTPVLLDADASTSVTGGPIGGQTRVTLRNNHLEYVITWYALTLATSYMLYMFRKGRGH